LLDNSHLNTICTRKEFAADTCPPGSQVGEAEAVTPLLDEPLRGTAYLRSSDNKLPDLVIDLEGQIHITAAARVDSVKGRLRTTFEAVPDVPLTKFVLDLVGGKKGLLINSEPICGESKRATVRMTGQNGTLAKAKVPLIASCGSKARHKRHHRKAVR
jgi:hypothetical protein